jgi:hypothetical protein
MLQQLAVIVFNVHVALIFCFFSIPSQGTMDRTFLAPPDHQTIVQNQHAHVSVNPVSPEIMYVSS